MKTTLTRLASLLKRHAELTGQPAPQLPEIPTLRPIVVEICGRGPVTLACIEAHRVRYSPEPGSVNERELCRWYDRKTATGGYTGD